jgi:hypothetical protein
MKEKNLYWSNEEYQKSVSKLQAIAKTSTKVHGFDDTTPGDKSTECNHGLCNSSIKPTASIYRQREHKCPLDTRIENSSSGCFYECAYFQSHTKRIKKLNLPSIKTMVLNFKIKQKGTLC